MWKVFVSVISVVLLVQENVECFFSRQTRPVHQIRSTQPIDGSSVFPDEYITLIDKVNERAQLKSSLFAKSAACDRGFGASTKDRDEIASIVAKLGALSPNPEPTRGLFPFQNDDSEVPIEGAWQMVYTTAFDVLSLAASPFTFLQGIYQVIKRDGTSLNVIDLAPRIQLILPVPLQEDGRLTSTFRARVFTTAKARSENRVGLTFKKVAVGASKFSNFDVSKLPKFGINFPEPANIGAGDNAQDNDPGFFDILYLDNDCLVIKQNAPGGIFVNIRSSESVDSFL